MKRRLTRNAILMAIVTLIMGIGLSLYIASTGTVPAATTGDLTNTATVTPPVGVNDPTPGNNTDTAINNPVQQADISLSKTLETPAPYTVGQTLTYTLEVHNAGPSTATQVRISDTPTNLTIQTVSGACTALPCTLASLAAGATATVTVTAIINAAGTFDNMASVTSPVPDPNSADNTDATGNGGTTEAVADIPTLSPVNLLALLGLLLLMGWSYLGQAVRPTRKTLR